MKNWLLVLSSFFIVFIATGLPFYGSSLFLSYLTDNLFWGRGMISVSFTFYWLMMGVVSLFTAIWIRYYQIYKIIFAGLLVTALGFGFLAYISKPWHCILIFGFIGIGSGLAGMVPVTELLHAYYRENLGKALGFASLGMSASGIISIPIIERLIASLGWNQSATIIAGCILLLIFPVCILLPRGIPIESFRVRSFLHISFSRSNFFELKYYFRTKIFWMMFFITLFVATGIIGSVTHLIAYITDIGFSLQDAALYMGILAGLGMIGKVTFGSIADLKGTSRTLLLNLLIIFGSIIMLFFIRDYFTLSLFVTVFGFSMGGQMPLLVMWPIEIFKQEISGLTLGVFRLPFSLGSAIGPLAYGYLHDYTGSYYQAFYCTMLLYLIAITLVYLLLKEIADKGNLKGLP